MPSSPLGPPLAAALSSRPAARSLWALDWLNFLMADVANGLGPYLAVFLEGGAPLERE